MKVIDLLNIKFCGNELPKQIKYNQKIFTKKGNGISDDVYYCSDDNDYEISHYINLNTINDEIEIIEKEKDIEKIEDSELEELECLRDVAYFFQERVNELIDTVNELKKEGK